MWIRRRWSSPGSGEGGREQPTAMDARLADPAGEEPGVPRRERALDLFEQPPLLGERRGQLFAIVEEDVDPDARVRAPDAGHVAQRATGRLQRVVPVDPPGPRLVEENVREHVRQVARDRDEPVVRVRPDGDRSRAERRDEPVQVAQPIRRRGSGRGHEPGRVVEQLRTGPPRATRLRTANRMPADEAGIASRRLRDWPLRRANVSDCGAFGTPVQHLANRDRQLANGDCDDDEVRVFDGLRETRCRLDGATLGRDRECVRIRIPAGYRHHPGSPCSERRGRTDQPGADDSEAVDAHPVRSPAAGRPKAITQPASARRRGRRGRVTAVR